VRAFAEFISDEVCNWLIERSRPRLAPARVYDSSAGAETVHGTRSNRAANFNLIEADLVQIATQARIAAACGVPLHNLEPLSVLHYNPGEKFERHFDFVTPTSPHYVSELARLGQRRMTFLIYLNDDYAGGETDFPRLSVRHRGRRRAGLCFANTHPDGSPDERTLHAGLPPVEGEKWIVSQFVRDRRVLGG
jgi:prolyl 4-hydroxylase